MVRWALVVACVVIIGLGSAGVGGELTGFAYSALWLDLSGSAVNTMNFFGVIDIDYRMGEFTLGSTAIVYSGVGLTDLMFDAYGWLGSVYGSSIVVFDASGSQSEALTAWTSIAWLEIAGVDLYAFSSLGRDYRSSEIGIGYALGGQGMAGDISLAVEAQFNMVDPVPYLPPLTSGSCLQPPFLVEGYRLAARGWSCQLYEPGTNFFQGFLLPGGMNWLFPRYGLVGQPSCCSWFSGFDFVANIPFGCLDLWAHGRFSCDLGFDFIEFETYDIELLSWLELDFLQVRFTVQTKSLSSDFDLILFESVCIDPIFELEIEDMGVKGITLRGLVAAYEVSPGVLFKAGTIIQPDDPADNHGYSFDAQGDPWPCMGDPDVEPEILCPPYWSLGALPTSGYDEYIAIIVDGDSCCGGAFMFSIFNWFDTGDDDLYGPPDPAGIFDWEASEVSFSVGIGSNFTLLGGLSVTNEDLGYLKIGVEFLF